MKPHPPHSKRRFITRVIVFLLLGAIVNVAVAWSRAACITRYRWTEVKDLTIDYAPWPTVCPIGFPRESWSPSVAHARGVDAVVLMDGTFDGGEMTRRAFFVTAGWPFRSLRGELWQREGPDETVVLDVNHLRGAFRVPALERERDVVRPIPWMPVWPGFLINTIFYAAILWILFATPFTLRRWRRVRKGLCPACAYPVGESEFCTECGKPVTRTHTRMGLPPPAAPALESDDHP